MSDIFREVDEEVRKDKAAALWKQYGSYVIIACVALVLGTAGRVGWQRYQSEARLEESQRYVAAVRLAQGGETVAASDALAALSADAGGGYSLVSAFQEAQLRAEMGDRAGAVAIYERIIDDGSAGDELRDLARLFAAMQQIDTAPVAELRQQLSPLLAADSPWRFLAGELDAVLTYREGDVAGARAAFRALAEDAEAPPGVRNRAEGMGAALGGAR